MKKINVFIFLVLLKLFIFAGTFNLAAFAQSQSASDAGSGMYMPNISVIIDSIFHNSSSKEGTANILGEIDGFVSAGEEEGHEHASAEDGLSVREVELFISANVDPYFKAWINVGISDEGAELEEAVIQTTALPYGFQSKAGRFLSDFGRLNAQHSHTWQFTDLPLIYHLAFGSECGGYGDNGVQLSWLAPTDFYLLGGLEVFQGNNEKSFNYIGEDGLPSKDGPRVFANWWKYAPVMNDTRSALQLGVSFARGAHQEIWDIDEDGMHDRFLNGITQVFGLDFVYKLDSYKAYGTGKFSVEGEYFFRKKDLTVSEETNVPALEGKSHIGRQDGYYLQANYGFAPRWTAGLRWEQVGLNNEIAYPDGIVEQLGASSKLTAKADWRFSEYSLLRFQLANGSYSVGGERENTVEFYMQLQITFGAHAAHKF